MKYLIYAEDDWYVKIFNLNNMQLETTFEKYRSQEHNLEGNVETNFCLNGKPYKRPLKTQILQNKSV